MRVGTPKFQASHGFKRGQPIVRSGDRFVLATEALGFTGIVGSILSKDQFELVSSGELDNVPNLISRGDNAVWYLSSTPGMLAATGTTPVCRVIGQLVIIQSGTGATGGGGGGGGDTITNITNVNAEADDNEPRVVQDDIPGHQGNSNKFSRGDHRHRLVLPPGLFTGEILAVENYDPKTGVMRHVRMQVNKGWINGVSTGPWHPYQEALPAVAEVVTPSSGTDGGEGAVIFHRASSAMTWDADADNVLLAPAILTEHLVEDDDITPVLINVPANAGQTWYGCVLPVRFRNNATSDTPRQWVIQLRDSSGIPADHYPAIGVTNKHNAETPWLPDLPWVVESDDDAAVIGYGGEMVVNVFLGLGIKVGEKVAEPSRVGYTIQMDAWLV